MVSISSTAYPKRPHTRTQHNWMLNWKGANKWVQTNIIHHHCHRRCRHRPIAEFVSLKVIKVVLMRVKSASNAEVCLIYWNWNWKRNWSLELKRTVVLNTIKRTHSTVFPPYSTRIQSSHNSEEISEQEKKKKNNN